MVCVVKRVVVVGLGSLKDLTTFVVKWYCAAMTRFFWLPVTSVGIDNFTTFNVFDITGVLAR